MKENPYNTNPCPVCGEFAFGSFRHKGAPVFCKNKHHWFRGTNIIADDGSDKVENHLTESSIKNKILKYFCEDKIPGGQADNKTLKDVLVHHFPDLTSGSSAYVSSFYLLKNQLEKGIKSELEHTSDNSIAKEIAIDHLWEDPEYYDKLETIEESK